ncbi:MAG: hypothetical protein GX270_06360 [Clostridiaceae bacterium]|nr:hypothetical protein [Clostridiaceae bacterium]
MRKFKILSGIIVFATIINLFTFTPKVNAISEDEQSKLSETVILYIGSSDSYVNNVKTKIDADNKKIVPIIKNGRTLVPVRFISESLKADVDWDSTTSIVTIKLGENIALLKPGRNIMALNNNPVELDVPPEIIDGRTYLPLRRLVEDVLDKNIFYDRNVIIISEKDKVFDKDTDKTIVDDLIYMYGQDYAITHISGGYSHTSAIKRDGIVWEWGDTLEGKKLVPERVKGLEKIIDISAGARFTVALKIDGTVWAWGKNEKGELGDGTQEDRENPVKVKGLTKIKRIAASYSGHCLALNSDGKVWKWGNYLEQLEDADPENKLIPVLIDELTEIEDIAVGNYLSVALDKDGNVWTWENVEGSSPQKVEGINNVIDVVTGQSHILALRNDGTVWTWGNIEGEPVYKGQINDEMDLSVPVKVEELSGVVAISAQGGYSVTLKGDGSVFVWGFLENESENNSDDELEKDLENGLENNSGDEVENESENKNLLIPRRINGLGVVREISAGGAHLLALQDDGSLLAFGDNSYGQIGDGTIVSRRSPTVSAFNKDPLVITEIVTEGSEFAYKFDDALVNEFDELTDELMVEYGSNQQQKIIDRNNMKVVVANNAQEFIDAIGSNREIILKSGKVYDITSALNEGFDNNKAYTRDTFDGIELVISNVENLIIRSESSRLAKIMVSPTYSDVLNFEDCENIVIDGVNAGHGPDKGECSGGVFSFERCQNIYINNSILYGCGTQGLWLSNVNSFVFDNSVIEDCSYSIMTVEASKDIIFMNSKFRNTGSYDLIDISDSQNVLFTSCEISNNSAGNGLRNSYHLFNLSKVEPKLIIKDTTIQDNIIDYVQKYKDDIYFKNITSSNNELLKGAYEID